MFKEVFTTCLDLLHPKSCHICSKILNTVSRAYDDNICWDCFSSMRKTPVVSCSLCGSSLSTDAELNTLKCKTCHSAPPLYNRLLTCFVYEGAARDLIHRFKYGNRPYLSKTIINLMTENLNRAFFREIDCLTPVPLHPVRLREREYNQSELIAIGLSKLLNKPVSLAVRRIKNTRPQATLDKKDRSSNLKNAFAPVAPSLINGKNILLVDDVVTTTATASEVSRILKNAGAKNVSILAFAKG